MDNQPQQRFCTDCGQPLAPGAAFCVTCGMQASAPPTGAPGQFSAGAQPGYPPPTRWRQRQRKMIHSRLSWPLAT